MKTSKAILPIALSAITLTSLALFAKESLSIKGSVPVGGKARSEYSNLAKVTLQEAIGIATKSTAGNVIEATLDKVDGFLVYEIELKTTDQKSAELFVDAGDGKILKKSEESLDGDHDDDEDED